jgi:glycosyltransferase involved in cell wall biosynthesis
MELPFCMTVNADLYFVIPGNIESLTGGYAYARRLLAALHARNFAVTHIPLPGSFPAPFPDDLAATDMIFSALPDGASVLIDGLAFGTLDVIAQRHAKRLRLIALCHHPLALETGLSSATAHALHTSEQAAFAAAEAVVVTSNTTGRILIKDFAVPAAKLVVAEPGTERQDFAKCLGDPPVLLTVATLTRRKAHDVLIAALANLKHIPWTARFAGGLEFDPEWVRQLRHQVDVSGLADRIRFIDAITDSGIEYRNADIFVLPSLYEGYGMVFAEALAFGLPIVGTYAGAVPEVVPPTAGILVAPSDIQGLTRALHRLLTEPALKAELQKGARMAAARLPRWDDTARVIAELVSRVQKQ